MLISVLISVAYFIAYIAVARGQTDLTDSNLFTVVTAWLVDPSGMASDYPGVSQDMAAWDVSRVTSMSDLFTSGYRCTPSSCSWTLATRAMLHKNRLATFNEDLSEWNTGAVTTMENMFYDAEVFNADVSKWSTGTVTSMGYMFYKAAAFNADVSKWATGAVTSMENMFDGATVFSCDVSTWDTGAVLSMAGMFHGASAFNGDVSKWNTGAVTTMEAMFKCDYRVCIFNQDLSGWSTTAVTSMFGMFEKANAFNGDVSTWSTGAVTSMENMFYNAAVFNGDVSKWSTGAVTTMGMMFRGAAAFSCDVSPWDTGSVTSMYYMFKSAQDFTVCVNKVWNLGAYTNLDYVSGYGYDTLTYYGMFDNAGTGSDPVTYKSLCYATGWDAAPAPAPAPDPVHLNWPAPSTPAPAATAAPVPAATAAPTPAPGPTPAPTLGTSITLSTSFNAVALATPIGEFFSIAVPNTPADTLTATVEIGFIIQLTDSNGNTFTSVVTKVNSDGTVEFADKVACSSGDAVDDCAFSEGAAIAFSEGPAASNSFQKAHQPAGEVDTSTALLSVDSECDPSNDHCDPALQLVCDSTVYKCTIRSTLDDAPLLLLSARASVSAGATSIAVADATGIIEGQATMSIFDRSNIEVRAISHVTDSPYRIVFSEPLANTYSPGTLRVVAEAGHSAATAAPTLTPTDPPTPAPTTSTAAPMSGAADVKNDIRYQDTEPDASATAKKGKKQAKHPKNEAKSKGGKGKKGKHGALAAKKSVIRQHAITAVGASTLLAVVGVIGAIAAFIRRDMKRSGSSGASEHTDLISEVEEPSVAEGTRGKAYAPKVEGVNTVLGYMLPETDFKAFK